MSSSSELDEEGLLSFIITGICGFNLRKGLFFTPHPYVKLRILSGRSDKKLLPHHKQIYRTCQVENTTNPTWKEQFRIEVMRTDVIELQVKNRFDKSRPASFTSFLGKVQLPVAKIVERLSDCQQRYTCALSKRNTPATTSGSLSFVIADGRSSLFQSLHHDNMRRLTSAVASTTTQTTGSNSNATTSVNTNHTSDSSEEATSSDEDDDDDQVLVTSSILDNEYAATTIEQDDVTQAMTSLRMGAEQATTSHVARNRVDEEWNIKREIFELITTTSHPSEELELVLPRRQKSQQLGFTVIGGSDSSIPAISKGLFVGHVSDELARASGLKSRDQLIEIDGCGLAEDDGHVTSASGRMTKQLVDALLTTPEFCRFIKTSTSSSSSSSGLNREDDDVTVKIKVVRRKQPRRNQELKRSSSCPPISTSSSPPNHTPQGHHHHRTLSNGPSDKHKSSIEQQSKGCGDAAASSTSRNGGGMNTTRLLRSVKNSRKSALNRVYSCDDPTVANDESAHLPQGWEACVDSVGRIFYVNHETRHSQVEKPTSISTTTTSSKQVAHQEQATRHHHQPRPAPRHKLNHKTRPATCEDRNYQQVMKRYQSIRRLVRPNNIDERRPPSPSSQPPSPANSPPPSRSSNQPTATPRGQQAPPPTAPPRVQTSSSAAPPRVCNGAGDAPLDGVVETDHRDEQINRTDGVTAIASNRHHQNGVGSRRNGDVRSSSAASGQQQHNVDYLNNPALKFLTHHNFNSFLQLNNEGYVMYSSNSAVRYMHKKISKDKRAFIEYQHNKELVKFVNCFADTSKSLPHGWEKKSPTSSSATTQVSNNLQTVASGNGAMRRSFFVNHNHRFTTFFDPRLPTTTTSGGATSSSNVTSRHQQQTSRLHVQSPLAPPPEQPPQVSPRPSSTLTHRSRPLDTTTTTNNHHDNRDNADDVIDDDTTPASYNGKVVAFLKQPNIVEIIKARYPAISTSQPLNYKLHKIRQEGLAALERFTNSIQLNIMLSLFEEEIMSFVVKGQSVLAERPSNISNNQQQQQETSGVSPSPRSRPVMRNFNSKLRGFYRKLEQKGYGQGPAKIKLTVNRDNLLEEAYRKIINLPRKELQRCKLFVSFAGEDGLDYSGPSREFFFLISRELFNPYYGLFEYSAVDTYTVQISPLSAAFVDSPLQWFQFAGRIIGLALIHHCLLDAFFARPLYKMLLRSKCSLSDLRYVDEQFYQSMTWLRDNDVTDVIDFDFTVDEEKFGKTETIELKPGGKNIAVTERNKKEYIERIVKWRCERGIKEQTNMLIRGFNEVVDLRLVSVFDAKELELVICGTADIDLTDWRTNTEYRGGYHDNHPVIVNFWSALHQFDNERRLRLLQFVTGTSSVPYEGFAALRGPNGPKKFCIEKLGSPASLPRAHTCFNRIDLPPYTSFQLLWEKLVIAVEETNTFGME